MFKQMKVGTRLIAGFLTLSILGAVVAAIGIYNMSQMNARTDRLYTRELLGISYVKEANINLVVIGRALRNVLLASSDKDRDAAIASIAQARTGLHANLDKARGLFFSEQGKRNFAEVDRGMQEYEALVEEVTRRALSDGLQQERSAVDYLLLTVAPKANELDTRMSSLTRIKERNAEEAAQDAAALYESSRAMMLMLVLAASSSASAWAS